MHTSATKSCIFTVKTVMVADSIVKTVNKSCLPAIAEQVIQEDGASASTKAGKVKWSCTCKVTK